MSLWPLPRPAVPPTDGPASWPALLAGTVFSGSLVALLLALVILALTS